MHRSIHPCRCTLGPSFCPVPSNQDESITGPSTWPSKRTGHSLFSFSFTSKACVAVSLSLSTLSLSLCRYLRHCCVREHDLVCGDDHAFSIAFCEYRVDIVQQSPIWIQDRPAIGRIRGSLAKHYSNSSNALLVAEMPPDTSRKAAKHHSSCCQALIGMLQSATTW